MDKSQGIGRASMHLSAIVAIFCLFIAWFFVDTLVVSVGSISHGVRFFDAAAVIADPTRMFFSIDTTFGVIAFGALCIVCLLLPVAPHVSSRRIAWLGYVAPLALIVVCGALLYSRTSAEILAAPGYVNSIKGSVMSLANKILQRGSDYVSKHVAIGVGGYLAALASVFLAYTGIHRLLAKPAQTQ